ncbi:MAG: hypothetical protein RJA44_174 [Pseudomonadota bacterium]
MLTLNLGLLLFLGLHSLRSLVPGWRAAMIARYGAGLWKLGYSLLALIGLWLIVHGYGEARLTQVDLWPLPRWSRHLAATLMLPAQALLVAAYVPGNRLQRRLQHPMVLGVQLWALAHLIANNRPADLMLFGTFLIWAVMNFRSARRRSVAWTAELPSLPRDLAVLVVGLLAWGLLAFWGHRLLIGVAPFGH